ncbi:Aminoglycoside phosphotransferase [Penicillium brevicompactum]|uniref:Aminoglycoside phosphotransferase n=1 Tax=Penicillium brevicompactum TaxID=5074 RepID=A0A9W9RDE2_PENBR|nr:Aminoglycoside phosphotransferase [Penicillium brevicompactum]
MDYDQGIDFSHQVQEDIWVDEINKFRVNGPRRWLLKWLYNVCQKFLFEDGTTLLLRFPRVKSISPNYADEKVAMEVEALSIIRERTTIPVPKIRAWGLTDASPLGLGPFILMEFIEGVCLNNIFTGGDFRLLKTDVSEGDLKIVYRQMANFMLQIFEIDFERIGSLPTPITGYSPPALPLTWKLQEIIRTGGVDASGDRTQCSSTTLEYFQYVIQQDWKQLLYQPSSIAGPLDALSKYSSLKTFESVLPETVNVKHENGPFKLICDDFGPANMIVKSEQDLTIVGVVDLEWAYAGPAQLFGSAPWWLLHDRPVNVEWDTKGGDPPEVSTRYFDCLKIFQETLAKEE